MILKAVRDVIVADAGVTAQLETYDFGAGDEPAVFTIDPIPADAKLPAVVVTQPSGDDWGTLDLRGAEVDVDVRVYGDKNRSRKALHDLAWDLWELLNWAELTVPGYERWGCFASGPPGELTDPDGFPGYLVPLTVRILEE